jgi:prepilin-type N-terminal cleavage/methylation domain-containing protein
VGARNARSGFTLVELLAVIAILAITLFMIVPGLDGVVPKKRLESAARRIASSMDLAQATAIGDGKSIALAYDLDRRAIWLLLPPKETSTVVADPAKPPPYNDVEHGLAAAPAASPTSSTPSYEGRESTGEDTLSDDVEIAYVQPRDKDEKSSGRIYIDFSAKGDEGSHIVGLRLKGPDGQVDGGQIWVKYSSLTRTFEFSDKKLNWDKVGE